MGKVERHQDQPQTQDPVSEYLARKIEEAETIHQTHKDACRTPSSGWVESVRRGERERVSEVRLEFFRGLLADHAGSG